MLKMAIVYHSESGNTRKMAELVAEGAKEYAESTLMAWDQLDEAALAEAHIVAFGAPTYMGSVSWQMKKCLDTFPAKVAGKLGGVFASAGYYGGGAETAQMTMVKGLLSRAMLVYSGGVGGGMPATHFGAVSLGCPEGSDADRCLKFGKALGVKAAEVFGDGGTS